MNRWLWGYGERIGTLVRNLFIVSFLLFPVGFHFLRDGLKKDDGAPVGIVDLLYFSLENVFPSGMRSGVQAIEMVPRVLAAIESVFGVVVLARFAAYIFRWSLH